MLPALSISVSLASEEITAAPGLPGKSTQAQLGHSGCGRALGCIIKKAQGPEPHIGAADGPGDPILD